MIPHAHSCVLSVSYFFRRPLEVFCGIDLEVSRLGKAANNSGMASAGSTMPFAPQSSLISQFWPSFLTAKERHFIC